MIKQHHQFTSEGDLYSFTVDMVVQAGDVPAPYDSVGCGLTRAAHRFWAR